MPILPNATLPILTIFARRTCSSFNPWSSHLTLPSLWADSHKHSSSSLSFSLQPHKSHPAHARDRDRDHDSPFCLCHYRQSSLDHRLLQYPENQSPNLTKKMSPTQIRTRTRRQRGEHGRCSILESHQRQYETSEYFTADGAFMHTLRLLPTQALIVDHVLRPPDSPVVARSGSGP